MKKIFLFLIVAAISLPLPSIFAQQNLKGQVLDLVSNQPIESANVFIANTQIGTTTDKNGNFTLENLPIGENYQL
ncbi:MAG: carboxypeptidase-like regulatory domain-containing protein, partial [Chitinophagales bacterium]